MPTLLTIGPVHALTQNEIYAMPARAVYVQAEEVVQFSMTTTTTDFANVAASTTGALISVLPFVRSTTANNNIIMKAT